MPAAWRTRGGVPGFLVGLALVVTGAFGLGGQLTLAGAAWSFCDGHAVRLSLLPLAAGAGVLFLDASSRAGWALVLAGALVVLLGILANPLAYFEPTSLFDSLLMLVLLAGGLGLLALSLTPRPPTAR